MSICLLWFKSLDDRGWKQFPGISHLNQIMAPCGLLQNGIVSGWYKEQQQQKNWALLIPKPNEKQLRGYQAQ